MAELELLRLGVEAKAVGWRTLAQLADRDTRLDTAVISAVTPRRFQGLATELSRLAQSLPLAVAGAGATAALAQAVGAKLLIGDPVTEAERMPPSGHIGNHPQ